MVPTDSVQGFYRWSITYEDGSVMDKYNDDKTKNLYVKDNKVIVPLTKATAISLTDDKGNVATTVTVPKGAVVFQRRIGFLFGGGVNYNNSFTEVEIPVPAVMTALVKSKTRPGQSEWVEMEFDSATNKYKPIVGTQQLKLWPARVIKKLVPEITYREYWIVGWRKREKDGSVTVAFDAVYPDGKVDHHNAWLEKPWLAEPRWKPEEQV